MYITPEPSKLEKVVDPGSGPRVHYHKIPNFRGPLPSRILTVHALLHMHAAKWLLNQFKQVAKMLRAYCSNTYFDHKV